MLLAELSLQVGDRESADKELERALAAGATAEQASAVRYELLLAGGRTDELAALLEKDTFTPLARRQLLTAKLQSAAGKADEAEQTLKSALAQAPDDADILLDLASSPLRAAICSRQWSCRSALPKSGAAHARALLLRGSIKMAQGQLGEAREELDQGSGQRRPQRLPMPREAEPRRRISPKRTSRCRISTAQPESLRMLDQWAGQSATTRYLHARDRDVEQRSARLRSRNARRPCVRIPTTCQAQLLLAGAHLGQGSLEQAEEALGRLLATQDNIAARKLLAQVYLARGQPERAQETLRAVLTAPKQIRRSIG